VSDSFEARLRQLADQGQGLLSGGRRGVEKESLRVTPEGLIARTPHPRALGSALTNQYITTDYSEALLEFVTPPLVSNEETEDFLVDIHRFVYAQLGDELLWPLSMPCRIRDEEDIPLAWYGTSNSARMKTIYRRGLGYRYGRFMQAISGIHFNYSVPEAFWPAWQEVCGAGTAAAGEFRSAAYLGLVRNARRLDWILLYLFGASPAVCKCFLQGRSSDLQELDAGTVYGPFATSLRMSDLGYQNRNQAELRISANSLAEYVRDLVRATRQPRPDFAAIGVYVNNEYRQLNANHLQIENEYYSTIRPKRVARSGERPTEALLRGGVEYVELRALDVSPFQPAGINAQQMMFMEVFLLYCLTLDSPPIDADEYLAIDRNHAEVARNGRSPQATLVRAGRPLPLQQWSQEILEGMLTVAGVLDAAGSGGYVAAVREQQACVADPGLTPSAQLIDILRDRGQGLADYGLQLAAETRDYFVRQPGKTTDDLLQLGEEARRSLERQKLIEASEEVPFDEFLANYFA